MKTKFTQTQACEMYRILEEIRSGLKDKSKNKRKNRLNLYENCLLVSIDTLLYELEK